MDADNLEEQAARQQLFITLYQKAFPAVAKYVCKHGGSFDEAKDVFQDALLNYYEKSRGSNTTINNSEGAYIYGTARYLWIKRYKEGNLSAPMDNSNTANIAVETTIPFAEDKLLTFLETAGKRCMELLRSFYYDQLPMTRVAQLFGFSGVRSATVQKYKCIEKVRETVKQKALTYEDFLE
ncbi:RNA polymerase sigma factor [Mucilaginibacter sp. SP1R1]|uniref:RNA polymerase sigma factor n=1 Tax=Mucilaginibacter sp. SP1R1 TaxID=2723091 RepID=UPI00161BC601|nr:sigma-70 family RNA polymerase sigma factor [Mucilaginibacter sp. SP1R1]MBB6147848.1 DNA-directed RNA polymerase specialized sigma24 family protein [Mucilaginibacter sp. SP1R1]